MSDIKKGIIAYLRVPFSMIVWVMETYVHNRARVKNFMAQPRVATTFKVALTITALLWIVVGFMATEDDKSLLTEALKGAWSDTQDVIEQRKAQPK